MGQMTYKRAAHQGPQTKESLEAEISALLNGYAPERWDQRYRQKSHDSFMATLSGAICDLERIIGIPDTKVIVRRLCDRYKAVPGANWNPPPLTDPQGYSYIDAGEVRPEDAAYGEGEYP